MVSRLWLRRAVLGERVERWRRVSDQYAAREAWDRYGPGYDAAFSSSFTPFAREALRLADVRPGMTLLDVAAGGGALSIPAAELGADVLATDLSSGMLDLLHQRAEEAGVSGIRTKVMDGTALAVDDKTFDRVCSQFGVMLFPDPGAGLIEMHRVTAEGGRGVVVIFGRPERMVPVWLLGQAVQKALPDVEIPPGSRLMTDPMSLEEAMRSAGFEDVRLEILDRSVRFGSAQGLWRMMSSSAPGFAMLLERLPDEQREAVRDALLQAAVERYGADFDELPVEVIVGLGQKG